MKFKGKRVVYLEIGEIFLDNLRYLRNNGIDYILLATLEDPNNIKEDIKKLCDEIIHIDSLDFKYLINKIDFSNIDGVLSVFKEDDSPIVKKLNEYIGNKYLFEDKQFKKFTNKVSFRKLCEKYSIPTPKTYFRGSLLTSWKIPFTKYKFPLIVKPSDLLAGERIRVVPNKRFFLKDILRAFYYSLTHGCVIEEFIDGEEFSATYVVQNGLPRLAVFYDKFLYIENQRIPRPFMCVFPSLHTQEFINKVDNKIKNMLIKEKLNNVTVFFQGMYKNGEFYIFESGLRLEGGESEWTESFIVGQNFTHFLIDNVLKVKTSYDINKCDPFLKNKNVLYYNFVLNPGIIESIEGFKDIKLTNQLIAFETYRKVGETIKFGSFLGNIEGGFTIVLDNMKDAYPIIKEINKTIKIKDIDGNDMIDHQAFNFNMLDKYLNNK